MREWALGPHEHSREQAEREAEGDEHARRRVEAELPDGPMAEDSRVRNPMAVVSDVRKVARPTSRKALRRAAKGARPARSSSR